MNYLERLRALENTKQTKKVCIYREPKIPTGTKETEQTKEVTGVESASEPQATHQATQDALIEHVEQTTPTAPLAPGWLVVYRDTQGRLRGGCDERDAGTVRICRWTGTCWEVRLTNGVVLPLTQVRSVAKTDQTGQVLAAWLVREHGADGEGKQA